MPTENRIFAGNEFAYPELPALNYIPTHEPRLTSHAAKHIFSHKSPSLFTVFFSTHDLRLTSHDA